MTEEYSQVALGALVTPLTAATTNTLLQDADPAIFAVLSFYRAMIATHLGARFDAEITRIGLPPALVGGISRLAIPYDPGPQLQKAHLLPPLLAVYRIEDRNGPEPAVNYLSVWSSVSVQYILPPLSTAQFPQLYPILAAISKVLIDRTEQGYDPTYQGGALVWGGPDGIYPAIQQIDIEKVSYGALEAPSSDLFFPALHMELKIAERTNQAPGVPLFTGADSTIGLDQPAGSEDFIGTQTNQ